MSYANSFDKALAGTFAAREKDWRNGAVVYQVLVDRFAPSADLHAKKALYPPPKVLRAWSELPKRGNYNETAKLLHVVELAEQALQVAAPKVDLVAPDLGGFVVRAGFRQFAPSAQNLGRRVQRLLGMQVS